MRKILLVVVLFFLSMDFVFSLGLKGFFYSQNARGDFELERKIGKLGVSVSFLGDFQLDSSNLVIRVMSPIRMRIKIGDEGIFYAVSDEPYKSFLGEKSDGRAFEVLSNFDIQILENFFSIQSRRDQRFWFILLSPKGDLPISRIEMNGSNFLREVLIEERNGNNSHLILTNVVTN